MTINSIERASARVALRTLEAKPDFKFDAPFLKRTFGAGVHSAIKEAEEEAVEYNKSMKELAASALTPEAAAYWTDLLVLIARGKKAQEAGDRDAEREIRRAAEALAEDFDVRVPDCDKPKFQHLDPADHDGTWDPRWSYVEYEPPLLREEFCGGYLIPNVKNHAQKLVLAGMAQPPFQRQTGHGRRLAMEEVFRITRADQALAGVEAWKKQTAETARENAKFTTKEQRAKQRAASDETLAAFRGDNAPPSLKAMKIEDVSGTPQEGGEQG